MACIGDLPEQLLQRLFAQVLTSSGLHGRCGWALPAVCRQWRAIWADEALWASSAVHRRLGSQATRASAAAARATYSCGWQPAWRAALTQRRNWQLDPARRVPRRGVQILRKAVAADSDGLTSLDCDASFRRVAVGCFAQSVRIYALPSPQSGREGGRSRAHPSAGGLEQLCVLPCHTETVWDVRWHGEEHLITGSFDGTIALHDIVATGSRCSEAAEGGVQPAPLLTMSGHGDRVMGVLSCSPAMIASAGRDGTVRRWDLRAPNRCVSVLRDAEAQRSAYCVTQSRMDEHMLISGHDGTVAIWDCRQLSSALGGSNGGGSTGLVVAVAAHTRMVMDLQLDESLECLATASRDDTTKLWHWPSLSCAAVLTGQVGVRSVQFDSEKVVTAANDRSVAVWKYPARSVADAEEAGASGQVLRQSEPEPERVNMAGDDDGDDDGGGTQPRLRAITPPRIGHAARDSNGGSSLSPLRTTATSGVEHRPLYALKHSAQVPRARFRTSMRHSCALPFAAFAYALLTYFMIVTAVAFVILALLMSNEFWPVMVVGADGP
jgi:hypothetical protein